jgi:hypothetical protein
MQALNFLSSGTTGTGEELAEVGEDDVGRYAV